MGTWAKDSNQEKRASRSDALKWRWPKVMAPQFESNWPHPQPKGLRVAVVGGGCSGFSYQMNFENESNGIDKVFDFDGLQVFVDQASLMYLDGTKIDYVETLEGAGFKFDNPNVKTTCGCGSSFSV
jgi:iron-sulfur cluster assembly accessory protein